MVNNYCIDTLVTSISLFPFANDASIPVLCTLYFENVISDTVFLLCIIKCGQLIFYSLREITSKGNVLYQWKKNLKRNANFLTSLYIGCFRNASSGVLPAS